MTRRDGIRNFSRVQVAGRLMSRLAEPVDGHRDRPPLVLIVDDSWEAREATALVV